MNCTFFGHRNCPCEMQKPLHEMIVHLIERENADLFYVGNHGDFDALVRHELIRLRVRYPQIRIFVILAYMPRHKAEYRDEEIPTLLPEGIERVPKRYAICFRNQWMLERADCVITYVRYDSNGAGKYAQLAEKQGKQVLRL